MDEKKWEERKNNLLSVPYIKRLLADRGIFVEQVSCGATKLLSTWLMSQATSILEIAGKHMCPENNRGVRMLPKHIEIGISYLANSSKEGNLIKSCRQLQRRVEELKKDLGLCNSRLNSAHALLGKKGERVDTIRKAKDEEEYVSKEDLEQEAKEELSEVAKRMK